MPRCDMKILMARQVVQCQSRLYARDATEQRHRCNVSSRAARGFFHLCRRFVRHVFIRSKPGSFSRCAPMLSLR